MELVDFKPEHLKGYVFRDHDLEHNSMSCTDEEHFISNCLNNPTYSLLTNGIVLSIGGGIEVMKGNFYTWQTPRHGFEKHIKDFVKGFRLGMNRLIKETECHRLYTICFDELKYKNWMVKGLGFEYECKLESYGGRGIDMIQYKKVVNYGC